MDMLRAMTAALAIYVLTGCTGGGGSSSSSGSDGATTQPHSAGAMHAAASGASSTPTGNAFACNNAQFASDQNAFAAGTINADQLVDICGTVTTVLPQKRTRSGAHGYFYVALPSGYQIRIVSNLDAMAQAPTNRPPSTWPWVAAGQYVFVQGRYYYDNADRQGVDWTEDDTGSWPYVGYVAVCAPTKDNCSKYW